MKRGFLMIYSILLIATAVCYFSCSNMDNQSHTELSSKFQNPPDEARPRVWWHWMNGNITKDGIRKDMEWMHRVGIRGVHNFDANLFTPEVVEKPLVFMTDDWKDAFRFATNLTDSLGFELTIAGSPGWSVTGGPWVEPADAMKKFVWTKTRIKGGQTFIGVLPQPSDVSGNFQNVANAEAGGFTTSVGQNPHYYKDAMAIAYRLSEAD